MPTGNPGYRGRRSHAVVPISECPIAAPLLVRRRACICRDCCASWRRLCSRRSFSLLQCRRNCDAGQRLRLPAQPSSTSTSSLRAVASKVRSTEGAWNSLVKRAMVEQRANRRTMGREFAHLSRRGLRLSRGSWRVLPGQSLAGRWARRARDAAGSRGRLAWDLFAGVGLFARQLAANFDRVVAVESAPPRRRRSQQNLRGTAGERCGQPTLDFLRRSKTERRSPT